LPMYFGILLQTAIITGIFYDITAYIGNLLLPISYIL